MKKFLAFLVVLVSVCLNANSQAPANDDCSNASPISIPSGGTACVTGTTVGATTTNWTTAICGQTNWTNDVWYTFVSTGPENIITLSPSGNPAARKLGLAVMTGGCPPNSVLSGSACDVSTTNAGIDTVIQAAPVGTQFWIEVSSFGTAGGFNLCVTSTTPPLQPGSTCATATKLCSLSPFTLPNVSMAGNGFTPSCFGGFTPIASVYYQFTVGVGGTLAWKCTPTGRRIELDWALYDVTNGCPGTVERCNFNFANEVSSPIGMSTASGTTCPTSADPGTTAGEFCPSITVVAGHTYVIFINNFTPTRATGWNFNFTGSTFQMAPVDTFLLSPDTICGNTGTVNLTNGSIGAIWQKWNFGDGSTAPDTLPAAHNYTAPGTYFISLRDSSKTGCVGVSTKSVLVTPYPTLTIHNDTICPGAAATVSATPSVPGGTFLWNPGGATTQSLVTSPSTTSTYTVTYTSPTNCSVSSTATVTVSSPTASVTPPTATICAAQNTTLTASVGASYAWSTGANTASIVVSPTVTTTYTVTVTYTGGCTATASSIITVNANPTATITASPAAVCAGSPSTLTATLGSAYVWSTNETTPSITVTPTVTTNYTVTVTFSPGCSAVGTGTVAVTTTPAAAITPSPDSICPGQSTTLVPSTGTSYIWSTTATTPTITVSPGATTTYSVTVTFTGGCTAVATSDVVVRPTPLTSIAPAPAAVCSGKSITITANGGNTFVWSTGSASTSITVTPANTTAYSVTSTFAGGCTAFASENVTVNSLPNISVNPSSTGICAGQTATLTANGGTAYVWNTGDNTATITVSPGATTTLTVTGTDANSCSATTTATVSIATAPTASIDPPNSVICSGQSQALTASGGGTYAWSDNSTAAVDNVSPTSTTTYTVTVSTGVNCSSTATATVVIDIPIAIVNPTAFTICADTSAAIVVTGSDGSSYLWSTGNRNDTLIVSPTATTTYTVTATDTAGCSATGTSTVTSDPFSITISPATSAICGGNNVVLTCSYNNPNTHGYFWSNSGLGNSQGVTAGPLVTTTYSVTTSDPNGCSASASAFVAVDNVVLSISPATPSVCSGQGTTLTATATGNATYKWSNNVFTDTNTVLPTATTQYNVTATDTSACTATDSVSVNLAIAPVATFTFGPGVCIGQPDTIIFSGSASASATYTWGFNGGNASGTGKGPYVVNWSNAGSFVVSLSINDNGCLAVPDSQVVTVSPQPISDAGTDTTFCSGTTVSIGTTSTTGYTYSWNPPAGLSSATVSNPVVTLSNTSANIDVQTFVVTTSNNGCTSADSVVLTIYPIPVPEFNDHAPQCLPGNSFNFIAQGSFLPSATFAWTFGPNSNPDSSVAQNPTVTYSVAETAGVSLTISQLGCVGNTYTDSVIIYPVPVAAFYPDTTLGCPNLNVCFTDTSTSVGPTTYLWNFGDGQTSTLMAPCHAYAAPGTYSVYLNVTAHNCSNSATDTNAIRIIAGPVARFTPSATIIQQPESEISFTNHSFNSSTYSWNFGGAGTSTDNNPSFNFTQYGRYNVMLVAQDTLGCLDTTEIPVTVLPSQNFYIPNVFTPNGDGHNDEFYIEMQEGVTVIDFTVFDRWGEKVHDGQYPWDGTFKGKPCPAGVYVYVFKLQLAANAEGIKRTGTITLLK